MARALPRYVGISVTLRHDAATARIARQVVKSRMVTREPSLWSRIVAIFAF